LHSNKHNHVTTTYYLLQKKYEGLGFDDDEKEKQTTLNKTQEVVNPLHD